ncbi:unnamed protein product [Sphagnum balticum]
MGQGRDKADGAVRRAEIGAENTKHGLAAIERGHTKTGPDRQKDDQSGRESGRRGERRGREGRDWVRNDGLYVVL